MIKKIFLKYQQENSIAFILEIFKIKTIRFLVKIKTLYDVSFQLLPGDLAPLSSLESPLSTCWSCPLSVSFTPSLSSSFS